MPKPEHKPKLTEADRRRLLERAGEAVASQSGITEAKKELKEAKKETKDIKSLPTPATVLTPEIISEHPRMSDEFIEDFFIQAPRLIKASLDRVEELIATTKNPVSLIIIVGTLLDKLSKLQQEIPAMRQRALGGTLPVGAEDTVDALIQSAQDKMRALTVRRTIVEEISVITEED